MTQQHKDAERRDAVNEFRRTAVARVVTATNHVRRAPILIESHRSKDTYDEQSRAILDARLELSLLRHDLESFKMFTTSCQIIEKIEQMEALLSKLRWSG